METSSSNQPALGYGDGQQTPSANPLTEPSLSSLSSSQSLPSPECETKASQTASEDCRPVPCLADMGLRTEESQARLEEARKAVEAKWALRQANKSPDRPDASFLRTLDSSVRRNTAVIKKLKLISEDQRESLLEEVRAVNLSKYVSEAVTAITEAKLKTADVLAAVQVCSLLHQRYKDFASNLIPALVKVFFPGKSIGSEADAGDRTSRVLKKRTTLRLLTELYFIGVYDDVSVLLSIGKDLTSADNLKDRDAVQVNLSLMLSFARQARGLLGLPPKKEVGEELPEDLNITSEQKRSFRRMLDLYFDSVDNVLHAEHLALKEQEQENERMLNARGELTEENAAAYEKLRKSYDQLLRNVTSLAEALDRAPPVMPEDGRTTRVSTMEEGAGGQGAGKDQAMTEPVWDDEDTRSFYESLPDLRAFVPAVLLGDVEPKSAADEMQLQAQSQLKLESVGSIEICGVDGVIGKEEDLQSGMEKKDDGKGDGSGSAEVPDSEKVIVDGEKAKERERERREEKERLKGAESASLDGLLQRLPGCVSRDMIDQLAVDFCYINSKSNRKKLVRALFSVPRTALELLPYYSRLLATLSQCMRDVAPLLVQMLEEEFSALLNKKDPMNIETKVRNIRFLGELAKFKLAQPGIIFNCLKACLEDFTHHNIDIACNLLETCGRYLFRSPETTMRMGNMLEIMMRLKNAKNLDVRQSTLVENAYYQCKPPERSARIKKARPPLHQYIRKLLFVDLERMTIEKVLRQMRKLPWSDCKNYILKCLLKVYKVKFSHIYLVASLVAGLSRYQDSISINVIDQVLEEIRVGLENNEYGQQQRRIAHMRFFGELYNYRVIDSPIIFETLYLILFYGAGTAEEDVLDPPEDCFRMRMVITLLETCGQFFDRGSSKRRLDRFLLYFQRYILAKGPIPLDVEFDLQDLFADLRPKMMRFTSFECVHEAVLELERQDHATAVDLVASQQDKGERKVEVLDNGVRTDSQGDGRKVKQKVEMAPSSGEQHARAKDGESESEEGSASDDRECDEEEEEADGDGDDDAEVEEDGEVDEEEEDEDREGGEEEEDDDEGEVGEREVVVGLDEEDRVAVKQSRAVDPEEDAAFEREYRAIMQESIEARKFEMRKGPTLNMALPMNLFEGHKDHSKVTYSNDDGSFDQGDGKEASAGSVAFRVLVKKGNKQQTRQLQIPLDCSLALSTRQKEEAELEEKQELKRLVLEYNSREEEDRMASSTHSMGNNRVVTSNMNAMGRGGGRGGSGGVDCRGRLGGHRQRRPYAAGLHGRRR